MQFELKRLHGELGITILYVTHDQEEALTMSDRIALMNKGTIEQLGRADELYEHPANRFVAEFIGESNVIEGRIEVGGGEDTAWFVAAQGARIPISPDRSLIATGQRGLMVLRPEKLSLAERGTSPKSCHEMAGRVTELVYVGDVTRYRVETELGLFVTVKMQNRRSTPRARQGETVCVVFDSADARIMPA